MAGAPRVETVNVELLTLTYGAIVAQVRVPAGGSGTCLGSPLLTLAHYACPFVFATRLCCA